MSKSGDNLPLDTEGLRCCDGTDLLNYTRSESEESLDSKALLHGLSYSDGGLHSADGTYPLVRVLPYAFL